MAAFLHPTPRDAPVLCVAGTSDFQIDAAPDTGIFVDSIAAGLDLFELLDRLFSVEPPPDRPEIAGRSHPSENDIQRMVADAEVKLEEMCRRDSTVKDLVEKDFSSTDARTGALCVIAFTMETKPIPIYLWLNGWLDTPNRKTDRIKNAIGPFFVAYHSAVRKLPMTVAKAYRAVKVPAATAKAKEAPPARERLRRAFEHFEDFFARGRELRFWAVACFALNNHVVINPDFNGTPEEQSIMFVCENLQGHNVSLLSAFQEKEIQPTTPSRFVIESSSYSKNTVTVFVRQVVEPLVLYEALPQCRRYKRPTEGGKNAILPSEQAKVVVCGGVSVGKTTLIRRFALPDNDDFATRTVRSTLGGESVMIHRILDNATAQIWDTSGQERHESTAPSYFRGAHGVLLMYAVNDRSSFDSLPERARVAMELAAPNAPVVVVGNKCDCNTVVTDAEGTAFAASISAPWFSTSARTSEGVLVTFETLLDKAMAFHKKQVANAEPRPSAVRLAIITARARRSDSPADTTPGSAVPLIGTGGPTLPPCSC